MWDEDAVRNESHCLGRLLVAENGVDSNDCLKRNKKNSGNPLTI